MKHSLVDRLRCPCCQSSLTLKEQVISTTDEIESGTLSSTCGKSYPVLRGVPRFVPRNTYADNFGLQWNRFSRTQLDSHSGVPISRTRFYTYSEWTPGELEGRTVLDVGCGAGRFVEVALAGGAHVLAIDYSDAVDACRANLGAHPHLDVVQADVYDLPLPAAQFDFVYCFGVLQHTPDPHAAFLAVATQLARGGKIAVDVYPRLLRNILWSKYWIRPISSRLDQKRLLRWVEYAVPTMLTLSRAVRAVPWIGQKLRYAIPVVDYRGVYPLSDAQCRELAVLDTFDMLAPKHDHPQTGATLRNWMNEASLSDISIERIGFFVGRARRAD